MKTKFIGLEGFNEIESLSTKGNRAASAQLSTAKKTVRFIKRASRKVYKLTKNNMIKLFAALEKKLKSSKKIKQESVIDKCYLSSRTGEQKEYESNLRETLSNLKLTSEKVTAHGIPRSRSVIKKKALLAVVACMTTVMLSCMTVASALEVPKNETSTVITTKEAIAPTEPEQAPQTEFVFSYSSNEATADETSTLGNIDNISITKAIVEENILTTCYGLYIDGELIGATPDSEALNSALEDVLASYRADYDENTTTEFANDVCVKGGSFSENEMMEVSDIIANADGKFSIALSTDIVYTREIKYETTYEYDDTKPVSYEKVKTKGKNGEERVTVRTTFTDGMQTDAVQTESTVLKKAVNKVVVTGSQETNDSDTDSSYSSGSTGTFAWPVPYTHAVSSYFEWRWGRMHNGIDIADSGIYGQTITAADGGTVVKAYDSGDGYGTCVIVDHGNGYQTLYAHCSSAAVSTGQYVSKGDTLGYVGSTGNSTGPHLHFEVIYNGNKLNPLQFVG